MNRSGIDFLPRPAHQIGAMVLAAGGLLAACWTIYGYLNLASERQSLESHLLAVREKTIKRAQLTHSSKSSQLDPSIVRSANGVIADIDKPWAVLLNSLERSAGDNASLLSIEPDGERKEMKLSGEARDADALFSFLASLAEQPTIRNAHIVGHQVSVQDPQRPVRFNIQASWTTQDPGPRPPTP